MTSMSWEIVSNYKLLCSVNNKYIFYHKGCIYVRSLEGTETSKLLELPVQPLKKYLVRNRLFERLLRLEPRLAVPLDETTFLLSYQGRILRINSETGVFQAEHNYRDGMNNPLSFCTFYNRILYGEYFGNTNREEVCVYGRNFQGIWNKKFAFPPGTVGHIHRIVFDKFRECLWILTGDSDRETGIWKADLQFQNVKRILGGCQKYRSCFLVPYKDGILYATDTPLSENAIYYSREKEDGTFEEPVEIYRMEGPCIYGKVIQDGKIVMATSVEPDAALPVVWYRITYRLGNGVKDCYSHLVIGDPGSGFHELCKFKKDIWGMWLFQFGNLLFPEVPNDNKVICTGQSLNKIDGKTIAVI